MIRAVPGGENPLQRGIAAAAEQFDITRFIKFDELFKKLSIGNMAKRREIPLAGNGGRCIIDDILNFYPFNLILPKHLRNYGIPDKFDFRMRKRAVSHDF